MPYKFTAEDFNKFSEDVLNAEGDQATLTTLLADMNTTIIDAIAEGASNAEKTNSVTAENERLKKANMDLFLRVGSQVTGQDKDKQTEEEKEPLDTASYMTQYFNSLDAAQKT